jgi:hypothetical protein
MENSPISFSFQFFQTPLKRILNSKVFLFPLLFSIIHLHVGKIGAQTTNLFTLSSLADSQLTSSQYLIKQSYQARESVASIQSVNLASPAVIQHLTTINLQIPGDTTTYTFSALNREAYSNGDYFWYGDLTDVSGIQNEELLPDGHLSIVGKSDRVLGEFRIDSYYYGLPSLGGGLNGIVKYVQDTTETVENTCISTGSGGALDTLESPDDRAPCPVVDVLILYTQEALDAFPDLENIGLQAFNNARQALLNSEVTVEQVDLKLVGIALLPGFTASVWPDDRDIILDPNSNAQQLRDQYHADLVFVFTPSVYPLFKGTVFGFGDFPSDAATAFSIVSVEYAIASTQTFCHELGHLFGGRHQWPQDCETNDDASGLQYAHGYSWQKNPRWPWGKFYKTLTSACNDNAQRITILNYSNPHVEYKNRRTGSDGWADNARNFRTAVCRISNYVNSQDVSAHVSAPIHYLCPGYSFQLRGFAVGDFGPYQFSWKYRLGSGGAWLTYTPTGAPDVFNFTVPTGFYGTIYVELTVTNGVGVATASSYAYSDYLYCPHRPARAREGQEVISSSQLVVIPNPAKDVIEVVLPNSTINSIKASISSSAGMILVNKQISSGGVEINRFNLDLTNLPTGFYYLTIEQPGLPNLAQKFMIVK